MNRLKSVLVGVDFSKPSKSALIQAGRIACRWEAELHVVHLIDALVVTEAAEATKTSREQMSAEMVDRAREQLETWLGECEHPEKVTPHVECGGVIHEMLKKVKAVSADLLILGVHGGSSGDGAGTFATKCVRKAPTKVLLVNEAHTKPYRTVVAGVDFSDITPLVVEQALCVAAADESRLHVLHVYYGPWNYLHYRAPTPEASPDFHEQYVRALQTRLEDCLKECPQEVGGSEIHCQLSENKSHGRGIVEYAKEVNADLVVLGTHGWTRLRYVLLGSTAERVLRQLPCSVLAIKPGGYGVKVE